MERRANSVKEEGLEVGLAYQEVLWWSNGCNINAKSPPGRAVLADRAASSASAACERFWLLHG